VRRVCQSSVFSTEIFLWLVIIFLPILTFANIYKSIVYLKFI